MAGEQILLDPTSEGTGTQLDITDSTLGYTLVSHDYPDPEPDTVNAGSIDTEGAVPAAGKHNPRTITAVVRCIQPAGGTPSIGTMVSNLQRKVGKLFREGGTYRRVLPSGDTLTFDVLQFGARISVPADKRWVTRAAADVTLTFTCKPYGRTPEVDLGDNVETTLPGLVFLDTGVKGDAPGLGRLVVDNDEASANLQWLGWGIQSHYYDSDPNAALFFQAEGCSAVGATAAVGPAGASGGGANKVMQHLNVGTTGADAFWVGTGSQAIEHVGSFRVYVRAWADSANTGIVSSRLTWYPHSSAASVFTSNDWTPIVNGTGAAVKGAWYLVDLGLVSVPVAHVGTQAWSALVQSKSTVSTDDVYYDCIFLVPIDEGAGVARDSGLMTAGKSVQIDHRAVVFSRPGSVWPAPTSYEGDYLLIPPAGAEARTVRVIVIAADGGVFSPSTVIPFSTIPDISAHLYYTPRYLSVPAP